MNQPESGRRFSQQEFAAVLRAAAELQARSHAGRSEGFTLAEMEQIASEAGIPAEYIRRAIHKSADAELSLRERFLGAPEAFEVEYKFNGILDDDSVHQLIDEARSAFGKLGAVQNVLDAVEWKQSNEFGSIHARVIRRAGETRIQVIAERGTAATLATMFGSTAVLVGTVVTLLFLGQFGFDNLAGLAMLTGATGLSYLGIRTAWRVTAGSLQRRISRVLDRMTGAITMDAIPPTENPVEQQDRTALLP